MTMRSLERLGPAQRLVHQFLTPTGDTYWVQIQNSTTPTSGTSVSINDTAPTTDRYNLSICEILPGSGSGGYPTPPTVSMICAGHRRCRHQLVDALGLGLRRKWSRRRAIPARWRVVGRRSDNSTLYHYLEHEHGRERLAYLGRPRSSIPPV